MEQDEDADADSGRRARGDVGVRVDGAGVGEEGDGEELVGWAKRSVPTIAFRARNGGHGARAPLPTLRSYEARNDGKLKAMRRYDAGKTAPLSALFASFRWDCR